MDQQAQQPAGSSAIASFILGIFGVCSVLATLSAPPLWLVTPIFCVFAFVLGRREVVRVELGEAPISSKGMAQVGWILGAIGFGLWLLETLVIIPAVLFLLGAFQSIGSMQPPG